MKFSILLDILFELLSKRKVTADQIAEKHGISRRTVYRYIDTLSLTVPVYVKQGRNGGICISDSYKLPMGFMTQEEYQAAVEALAMAYSQLPEEKYLVAKHKLTAQMKKETRELTLSGNLGSIIVDSGTWGDTRIFSDKLRFMEDCIAEKAVLEIDYHSRLGESSHRKIEPHVLVFKQNVWYVYAFCRKQRAFRLFRLGRIYSSLITGEKFIRRSFKREDIPLSFWATEENSINVRLLFTSDTSYLAQDWLGTENMVKTENGWLVDATLPNDETLLQKIVGFGSNVKVLAPESLQKQVLKRAKAVCSLYE
ncbi:MAG: YafY family transcriptional regulator [Clostridia bacterium]|nr:YafY family transcriptional regulator [Clostridia bacterium]